MSGMDSVPDTVTRPRDYVARLTIVAHHYELFDISPDAFAPDVLEELSNWIDFAMGIADKPVSR